MVDDTIKEITDKLDFISRVHADTQLRYDTAQQEARKLAQAVYDSLTPKDTDAFLRDAYNRFMAAEAGGFLPSSDPYGNGTLVPDDHWGAGCPQDCAVHGAEEN